MKGMNCVLKCRQGNAAHPLWTCCRRRVSCPYCSGAGRGDGSPCTACPGLWLQALASAPNSLGSSSPHTAAHLVPAPPPKLLCPFFIAHSFYLAALLPAPNIGSPGAEDELCKWKQQIELPVSRSKQGITAALAPKMRLSTSNSPFLERLRLYRSPVQH